MDILYTDSHTLDGCDRVMLDGDQVVVQGRVRSASDFPSIRVPDGEGLSGISVEAFLAAAHELERRMGQ